MAGAGVRLKNYGKVNVSLTRYGERTNKKAQRAVIKGAKEIAKLARAYAPVDMGDLEKAIVLGQTRGSSIFDRIIYSVEVDPDKLGMGYWMYGYRYDIQMHEGQYNLGPKSAAKEAATGKKVGRKFMTRAIKELEPSIRASVVKAMKDEIPK